MTRHPEALRLPLSAPVRITPEHDLSQFDCGRLSLNEWLRGQALRSERDRYARTFVSCAGPKVAGYYCTASGGVERAASPGKVRRNAPDPIPVAIIGRLGVDLRWTGKGLGTDLLHDAFKRIIQASEVVGIKAILVHAIDDEAKAFYMKRAEFIEYPAESRTLFLPIETLAAGL